MLRRCKENRDATLSALPRGALRAIVDNLAEKTTFSEVRWGRKEDADEVTEKGERTFDLVLGSDVIYSSEIVGPLFKTVGMLLKKNGGKMVMAQSFEYDAETEKEIDEWCDKLGFKRSIVMDEWGAELGAMSVKGRVQIFEGKSPLKAC